MRLSESIDNPDENCILIENSAQFENTLFTHVDTDVRYVGLVDDIKVTLAVLPAEHLGYFTDTSTITDKDSDGLNDNWEEHHFGSICLNGDSDSDGDGINDRDEFFNGTDPTGYDVNLRRGWNLISLAKPPKDNSVQAIFASVDLWKPIWTWENGRYVKADIIKPLQGYWICFWGDKESVSISVKN